MKEVNEEIEEKLLRLEEEITVKFSGLEKFVVDTR